MINRFSVSRPKSLWGMGLTVVFSCLAWAANAQQPTPINVIPPELVGGPWLNTPQNKPIKLTSRKGKVTVVEFWTFG